MLGTAIEYYDFTLYATMTALVFDRVFFPDADPGVATVAAFGTLAAGYVARPIGGIVFGHFGDRLGRKRMLVITMLLMGVVSFLIGLLPTYEAAGILAPILLVAMRIGQGIAIGGEWAGATLMVNEHADPARRGRWNALMQMGSPIGGLLSTGAVTLVALLDEQALLSWGWRIPFLFSAVLLLIGLYVRFGVTETPVYEKAVGTAPDSTVPRLPLAQVLCKPRRLALACAVGIGPFALTALLGTYMISYTKGIGYPIQDVLRIHLLAAITGLLTIPLFSALTDLVGRRTIVLLGASGIIVGAVPIFALIDSVSGPELILASILAQVCQSAMYAPLGPLLSEIFDTPVRFTGVAMAYQLAALIGAGFTPLLASALLAGNLRSGPLIAIAVCSALLTIVATLCIKETRGRDLSEPAFGVG